MISRAQNILNNIRQLYEELFFPTTMALRPMTPSESNLYKATSFPNSDQPCVGTFLNVSWVAILDYFGLKIQAINDPTQCYIVPYRASSCQELATQLTTTLDTLVSLTDVSQLYDADFLTNRKFVPSAPNNSQGETSDELQQQQ